MDIETKKWEVLCSKEQIDERLKELGSQISEDYKDKNLLVVSLLKGSFIFCADLVRQINVPVRIEFMTTASYGHGEESSGTVNVVSDVKADLDDLVPDYCGFTIEDKFVVGYGLNFGDYYRNVPYVFNVTNEDR